MAKYDEISCSHIESVELSLPISSLAWAKTDRVNSTLARRANIVYHHFSSFKCKRSGDSAYPWKIKCHLRWFEGIKS